MLLKNIFADKQEFNYFVEQIGNHNSKFELLKFVRFVLNNVGEEKLIQFISDNVDKFEDVELPDNYDDNRIDGMMLIDTIRHGTINNNRRVWANNIFALMVIYVEITNVYPENKFSDIVYKLYDQEYNKQFKLA